MNDKSVELLKFLKGRLSDDDFETAENLLDDTLDDATEPDSPKAAMDSHPRHIRRGVRRALRSHALGQDVKTSRTAPTLAADASGFESRYPEAARIKIDDYGKVSAAHRHAGSANPSATLDRFPALARIRAL